MRVNKVTVGFVVQTFDTETGKWTGQEFIASDDETWEDECGESVDEPDNVPEAPALNMEQPKSSYSVASVWSEGEVETLEEQNDWEFTPEERQEILDLFKHREDATIGLNWDGLETACREFLQKKCR